MVLDARMVASTSDRLLAFIMSLPDHAFSMAGEVGVEDRILFTAAPPGTPMHMLAAYPRVTYRFGWMGMGDKVSVSFILPTSGGPEILSVAVQAGAWGALAPSLWKQMISRNVPLGVREYPVQM